MSSLLFAELAATCNAIGKKDGLNYYPDDNCAETLKDLIRYLRRDGDVHEIRRHLGETKVLQYDLLPLIRNHWKDADIFSAALRLMVNLTNPVMFLYGEDLPTEKVARNQCEIIQQHLISYKEAFADEAVWAVFCQALNNIFRKDQYQRGEEDTHVAQRILILMSNLLRVPPSSMDEKRPNTDTTLHDQLLWCFHTSGMNDILTYISTNESESSFFLYVLEISHFMFLEQNPKLISDAIMERSLADKKRDEKELLALKEVENKQRAMKFTHVINSRHSRFGGTFVVKDFKSIGDNDLLVHKPVNKLEKVDLDKEKKMRKLPKNRRPMQSEKGERISAFSIRFVLREFCIGLLTSGGFSLLMRHARRMIDNQTAQQNDETYFLWNLWFFMNFNRCYYGKVKYVSETMNIQTFHFVSMQLEKYYSAMNTDKKHIHFWSKRMHYAIKVYKELLCTLGSMDCEPKPYVRQAAQVIKSNIFYNVDYRELILTFLVYYDERKFSLTYLTDLIKTTHIFQKLLERFCKKNNSSIVIQKVQRKKKPKKKEKKQKSIQPPNLEQTWDNIAPELAAVLQQSDPDLPEVVPFDATSDKPIDEQKADAMVRIHQHLLKDEIEMAISLLRAARDVWPENDHFGSSNMTSSEEFLALRDIFMANLQESNATCVPEEVETDADDELNEEEEDEPQTVVTETQFNFKEFIQRFAQPHIVRALGILLRNFLNNDECVNHCILKMLHRIAVEAGVPALLYQVSLFRTFQRIMEINRPCDKELIKFANYILRFFRRSSEKNPKIFMEALFWTTKRDAIDVVDGSYNMGQNKQVAWSEEQEDELRRLYEEYQAMEGGEGAMDVGGWILANLIRQDRTKRGVNKKLREMGYDLKPKRGVTSRAPKQWGEDEEAELTALWEQFQESDWPLGNIVEHLTVKRPPGRVAEKLLEMGLASDKKELHKKRKSKKRHSHSGSGSELSQGRGSSDDEERVVIPKPLPRAQHSRTRPSNASQKHVKFQHHPKHIRDAIYDCIREGCIETLEWLKEQLEFAVEDGDLSAECPLLPTSATTSQHITLGCFQTLFNATGVTYVEQSVYPRVSKEQTLENIIQIISLIDECFKQDKPENVLGSNSNVANRDHHSSSSEDEEIGTATSSVKNSQRRKISNDHSSSSGDENIGTANSSVTNSQRKKISNDHSSSSGDEEIGTGNSSVKNSQRRKISNDHSNSSGDEEIGTGNSSVKNSQRRKISNDHSSSSGDEEIGTGNSSVKNSQRRKISNDHSSSSGDKEIGTGNSSVKNSQRSKISNDHSSSSGDEEIRTANSSVKNRQRRKIDDSFVSSQFTHSSEDEESVQKMMNRSRVLMSSDGEREEMKKSKTVYQKKKKQNTFSSTDDEEERKRLDSRLNSVNKRQAYSSSDEDDTVNSSRRKQNVSSLPEKYHTEGKVKNSVGTSIKRNVFSSSDEDKNLNIKHKVSNKRIAIASSDEEEAGETMANTSRSIKDSANSLSLPNEEDKENVVSTVNTSKKRLILTSSDDEEKNISSKNGSSNKRIALALSDEEEDMT